MTVSFVLQSDEADEDVARLIGELAQDLREVGEVEYVQAPGEDGAKGADVVVAATLAVLTASDPVYVQALVDTVVAFLRRHEGRRARLAVGDAELQIDRPSADEVAQLIDLARSAIEARAGHPAEH